MVVVVVVVVFVVVVVGAVVVGAVVVDLVFAGIEEVVEVEEAGSVGRGATVVEVDEDVAAPFAECVVNPPLNA
jgi:hypothetical protein